ncbi:MAG: DNA repair protein rad50 [Phylliscum demangeonii]|nr:MAG: DNA repair protein rad50 [Phylliscum demangeonii]
MQELTRSWSVIRLSHARHAKSKYNSCLVYGTFYQTVYQISKIDKLSILGVRSFDNTRSETIQLHTPLTLIVGHNGSGKTTIIECLKYATTGELPPNSKGGAFIHDPKLCGEKEVLAQVKLSFKSTSGAKMVATRSLQLTVTKNKRSQKTLEGQLLMVKDGERTAISSRAVELDQIMPQYLGASRAILDSVIFCHQDESLWPMSEPATLKKKFDQIFEAQKYTKAIENIKLLRKHQGVELDKLKLLEQQYKTDKDRADRASGAKSRAQKQSKDLNAEIEALRAECMELRKEIDRTTRESERLWNQAAGFEQIIATLNGKRIEAQAKKESIDDLSKYIQSMTESDEWLATELEKYEERMSVLGEHIQIQLELHETLRLEMDICRQKLGAKMTEAGKFEAEAAQYERQLARRETLVKEAARSHNIHGFNMQLDDGLIADFMSRLSKMSREQNVALERVKRETNEQLQQAQDVLNQLGQKRSAFQQSKDHGKSEITHCDRKVDGWLAELNRIDLDEGGKATLVSAVGDVEARLKDAKAGFTRAAWDEQLQTANQQVRTVEEKSQGLNAELVQGTRQASELARLEYLQQELKYRQSSLDTMKATYGDRIADIVGAQWLPSSLEQDFQSVLDQSSNGVAEAQRQRDGVSRELEQVEFTLQANKENLKKKDQELQECTIRIKEAIGDEPNAYLEIVSQLEQDRDIRKSDVDNFKNLQNYYSACIKAAKENNACRLCERKFERQREQLKFVEKLEKLISKVGQETLVEELKTLESELKGAREVRPSYDAFQRLSMTDLSTLQAEIDKLQGRRTKLLALAEEQDTRVRQRQDGKKELETMAKTVQSITKYHTEIAKFESQVQELSINKKDDASLRTLEAIQAELASSAEESRTLKNLVTKLHGDKERGRSQITTLELELRDLREKLTEASHQLEKKTVLLAQVEEYRSTKQKLREEMERTDDDIAKLTPLFAKARTQYDDAQRRGAEKEKDLQQESSRLSDSVHQLKLADQEINTYQDKNGPQQLDRCQQELDQIKQEMARLEKEQHRVTVEINQARKHQDQHDETKRTISDNLRYRRDVHALEVVEAEIAELEAKNAEVDRDRFMKEADRMSQKHRKLSAEEASKMGAMKSKDDQLARLLEDWETDYRDSGQKYKETHIKVEVRISLVPGSGNDVDAKRAREQTTKAAVADLKTYGAALDKAIMKYHGIKMDEINQLLEELWKKTYRGTDIDTVMIRSENETTQGNRAYNYRVSMVKQDAEMDMRGRCSAGQKVLACILIRLALAECFGTNCGLIALDEPTTNLDRDNIRSLAESLHDIIATRQLQANFQLIVITHDEEFLRHMKCADFCDVYYRVMRDDRQKSIIER